MPAVLNLESHPPPLRISPSFISISAHYYQFVRGIYAVCISLHCKSHGSTHNLSRFGLPISGDIVIHVDLQGTWGVIHATTRDHRGGGMNSTTWTNNTIELRDKARESEIRDDWIQIRDRSYKYHELLSSNTQSIGLLSVTFLTPDHYYDRDILVTHEFSNIDNSHETVGIVYW